MIRRKTSMDYSHVSPDMTPMIDMVFILLIFVLVAASFVKVAEMEVTLPASAVSQTVSEDPIVVEITASGTYKINDEFHQLDEIIQQLAQLDGRQILVAADKTSQTRYLIDFLEQSKAAKITNLKVAVQRDG